MTTARTPEQARLWQTHPRYDEFADTWRLLGECVEGDGGFLDGTNLVAHPRELHYKRFADNTVDPSVTIGETEKFKRRKRLARYDHLAGLIVDQFVAYQYAKPIRRSLTTPADQPHPLELWWQNVDGDGTHIDDWMRESQYLANVYGFVWTVLDRVDPVREGAGPTSRADEGGLVLRRYIPLDCLDWLAPRGVLTACKFIEAKDRDSLFDAIPSGGAATVGADQATDVEFRVWDAEQWQVLDGEGALRDQGAHGYGEVPVVIHYARRRPRIPIIGRSLLGDGRLFKEHYNLVSELRELMRGQTFSVLNIMLPQEKTPSEGRALLGEQLSIESILWSWQPAQFIAPSSGPVADYMQELLNVERKVFRLVGLPWDADSSSPESGDSRRLKAMDLNRLLALHADQAEKFEYQLARLWCLGTYGRDAGLAAWDALQLAIKYPDEFHTEDVWSVINTTREAKTLRLGPTADAELNKRALPVVLPDLSPDQQQTIEDDIDAQVTASQRMREAAASSPIFGGPGAADDEEDADDGEDDGTDGADTGGAAGRGGKPRPPTPPTPPARGA